MANAKESDITESKTSDANTITSSYTYEDNIETNPAVTKQCGICGKPLNEKDYMLFLPDENIYICENCKKNIRMYL